MKTYKDFRKIGLGFSDIAALVLRGCDCIDELHFGGDGHYSAYLVTEEAEIGEHYKEVFRCHSWLWIYDDERCVCMIYAPDIIVYRAGEMGCVIYAPRDKEGS